MGNYAAYPAYKASGVEWLGEIPAHWIVKKIGYVAVQNSGGAWGSEDDESDGTIILRSTEQTIDGKWQIENPARRLLTPTEKRQTLLVAGDLLITKSSGSKLHIGKTTIVDHEVESLQCGFSNFMQRLRLKQEQCPKFYYYLFNSKVGREQFDFNSNTTTGLANLNGTVISATLSALPPLPEQEAIARFLDNKTAQIDGLIAKKEALLARLADKRTALISQAVTKGLDPRVPMRDSGVEWLGEIPEHWETVKGKYLFDIYSGYAPDAVNFEGEDLNYFKVDDLNKNPGSLYMNSSSNSIGKDRHITLPEAPIILFPKRGAAIATNKVKIIENAGVYDTNLMGLKPNEKIEIEFLVYSLLARGLWDMADVSTVPQINNKHINPMAFPVPGRSEQQAIVQYLNEHTTTVDQQRAKVGQAIGKLKQYRTALITSAVTGKIDVQGVA